MQYFALENSCPRAVLKNTAIRVFALTHQIPLELKPNGDLTNFYQKSPPIKTKGQWQDAAILY